VSRLLKQLEQLKQSWFECQQHVRHKTVLSTIEMIESWTEVSVPSHSFLLPLFMVALCNRADHYIFMLWFVMAALWNRAGHYIFAL